VVLGGMGHVPGVILGALLLAGLPEALRHVTGPIQQGLFGHELIAPEALRMLLFGTAMVVVMLYRPQGLWPAPSTGRRMHGAPPGGQAPRSPR
jgi:branched-chain amino acid transport system permease protein